MVRSVFVRVLFLGLLTGCSSFADQPAIPTPDPSPGVTSGELSYPVPGNSPSQSYPGQPIPIDLSVITPRAPETAPDTDPGTASISGVLVSRDKTVIINVSYYLAPGEGEDQTFPPYLVGPDPTRGDIAGTSDGEGRISLANIPPGKYFMFVSSPYGWNEVEVEMDNPSPRLFELAVDQRAPLGTLLVTWP